MSPIVDSLARQYFEALEAHVRVEQESTRSCAYELGRLALTEGMGILDIVALHQEAVFELMLSRPESGRAKLVAAADNFFQEMLSPFEMTLRGYREANVHLQRMNEYLNVQRAKTEAANKELEAFSYSVAHDLRAPLRSISGFSQLLSEDCTEQLGLQGLEYLKLICESARHMSRLIDDLLQLSRVTLSDMRREKTDLSDICRRLVERLQAVEPRRPIEIVVAPGVTAYCDSRLTEIVLQNLIGNAWKFTSRQQRPRIEFGRQEENGRPVYFVRDNGAGFDMNYADKLFGVFQRLHSPEEFEGTGIGLATVQRIVHRHGGTVRAEGHVNEGATFYFTLEPEGVRNGQDWRSADEICVPLREDSDAAIARKYVRELAGPAGLCEAEREALATAVSEIVQNIVVHAGQGIMRISVIEDREDRGRRGIAVVASDQGPGIADIRRAMEDGYSTGKDKSLGLGLSSAERLVDEFRIKSEDGRGTEVTLLKWGKWTEM